MIGEPTLDTVQSLPGAATPAAQSDAERLAARNALALTYRPYVYKVARDLLKSMRVPLEVDDLVGWGTVGLLEAAERYDPARGTRFRSYAHARIRGAMIDAIRTHYGRRLPVGGGRAKPVQQSRWTVCGDAGFSARDASEDLPEAPTEVPDDVEAGPDREIMLSDTRRLLEAAIGALSPIEQSVIVRYYVHGETVCAIARQHHLSKSWLSRIRWRAVHKLRRAYTRLESATRERP